jgi:hypothetical protein
MRISWRNSSIMRRVALIEGGGLVRNEMLRNSNIEEQEYGARGGGLYRYQKEMAILTQA